MIEVIFRCLNCGHKFKAVIFEKGEAEEKRRPTAPVRCPNCKKTSVEKD